GHLARGDAIAVRCGVRSDRDGDAPGFAHHMVAWLPAAARAAGHGLALAAIVGAGPRAVPERGRRAVAGPLVAVEPLPSWRVSAWQRHAGAHAHGAVVSVLCSPWAVRAGGSGKSRAWARCGKPRRSGPTDGIRHRRESRSFSQQQYAWTQLAPVADVPSS